MAQMMLDFTCFLMMSFIQRYPNLGIIICGVVMIIKVDVMIKLGRLKQRALVLN
jgi:hypothetical protein